jgi:hypothetical protein
MRAIIVSLIILIALFQLGCDNLSHEKHLYYESWLVFKDLTGKVLTYIEQDIQIDGVFLVGGTSGDEYVLMGRDRYNGYAGNKAISRMNIDGSGYEQIVPDMETISVISHDRNRFIAYNYGDLFLINIDGTDQILINDPSCNSSITAVFSTDDTKIAYVEYSLQDSVYNHLIIYDITAGQRSFLCNILKADMPYYYQSFAWLNNRIYYTLKTNVSWVDVQDSTQGVLTDGDFRYLIGSEACNKIILLKQLTNKYTLEYFDFISNSLCTLDIGYVNDQYAISDQGDNFIINRYPYDESDSYHYNESCIISLDDMSYYSISPTIYNPSFDVTGEKIFGRSRIEKYD